MKHILLLLTISLLLFSCKKSDDSSSSYNGFKVDGVVYKLDRIEHDFNTTRVPLTIFSSEHGGARLYFHFVFDQFPSADGAYSYKLKAVAHDSADVTACFEPYDSTFSTYCAVEGAGGQSLATLSITISGGKWSISAPAIMIMDNTAKTLEVNAHE